MANNFNVPKVDAFKGTISEDSPNFKPEDNRYHLYISYACPFAHRANIARKLKGLEEHIGLSVTHPVFQKTKPDFDDHIGWVFKKEGDEPVKNLDGHGSFPCKNCTLDTINNAKTIRDLYDMAGGYSGRYSVPVLWDKKNKTIVNNESADIIRIFNSGFNKLAKNPELDLYPEALRAKVDEINEWVFKDINIGVYKAGFAEKQDDYEKAFHEVFAALDKAEEILSHNRYLCGSQFTEADVRIFPTLVRFDEVYNILFKLNKKKIVDYPNLLNYCREIYQMPGISETVDLEHIKQGYFANPRFHNSYAIVPVGPDFLSELKKPHDRNRFK